MPERDAVRAVVAEMREQLRTGLPQFGGQTMCCDDCAHKLLEHLVAQLDSRDATRPAPVVTEAVDRVMQGYADAYPTDVWPETPFTDAQAASVMRLMVPRIRESLAAALAAAREGA